MCQQGLGRAVEDAIDKLADHGADHLALGPGGPIDVGAVGLLFFKVTLLFQDVHHGHDGGVGDPPALEQRFINLADGRFFELPDDLHDFEFQAVEGRLDRAHTKTLVRVDSEVKPLTRERISTNELVCLSKPSFPNRTGRARRVAACVVSGTNRCDSGSPVDSTGLHGGAAEGADERDADGSATASASATAASAGS